MRPILLETEGYQADAAEKVERLLELLSELNGHPYLGPRLRYLGPRLRLHGGTALNVFHLPMPRLSIDADLTYVGRVKREECEVERPEVERAVTLLGKSLGYEVTTSTKTEHAGRTMKLRYGRGDGRDLIKVDLIYLNRAPLLDAEYATCLVCSPEVHVRTLALPEIVAGKTKALFDRRAVRDLYDVHRIQSESLPMAMAEDDPDVYRLQRRVRLFYVSLSKPFPCPIDEAAAMKFETAVEDVENELLPVLTAEDRPSLEEMIRNASDFIREHVRPRDEEEREYLRLFGERPDILERARLSPAAEWKVRNLKKRPEPPDAD
jgi:hypothetical protein